jgi:hypothetical protein
MTLITIWLIYVAGVIPVSSSSPCYPPTKDSPMPLYADKDNLLKDHPCAVKLGTPEFPRSRNQVDMLIYGVDEYKREIIHYHPFLASETEWRRRGYKVRDNQISMYYKGTKAKLSRRGRIKSGGYIVMYQPSQVTEITGAKAAQRRAE